GLFRSHLRKALPPIAPEGRPWTAFRGEQLGGKMGGPIVKEKMFFFGALEQILENFSRANLSEPIGSPCSVSAPTITANEALINSSADCQRLALINFFKTNRNQDEGLPGPHPIRNSPALAHLDWNMGAAHKLGDSCNFVPS